MSNTFINSQLNKTFTENGAYSEKSTLSKVVDLFFHGAALRNSLNLAVPLFKDAFAENPTEALRILFYIRDIRGGQGERDIFRNILVYLGNHETDWVIKNLNLIPEYGRWDDMFVLLNSKAKDATCDFILNQLMDDIQKLQDNNGNISLLAKWLPSECTKNINTKNYYNIIIKAFNAKFSDHPIFNSEISCRKAYRQMISALRAKLNIVETNISKKEYNNINYETVPSYAMKKYGSLSKTKSKPEGGAFIRNDAMRFTSYLDKVKSGEAKINSSTLFPYNLVHNYFCAAGINGFLWPEKNNLINIELDATIEAQWKALPDYVPEIDGLVIADTSGSMSGLPIEVSISLAIYIAERNKSEVWRNYVIPFSSNARFIDITENNAKTLKDKINNVYTGDCSNTNLQAVFDLILDRSVHLNIPPEDMPKQLIIISDMQFDPQTKYADSFALTNYEVIKKRYTQAGYTMPNIVWWNVASCNINTPVTINDKGNILLSGCSPAIMNVALNSNGIIECVNQVINSDRYKNINY